VQHQGPGKVGREPGWPETIVLDSTEFQSNDTFTGGRLQVFTVLHEQAPFLLDGSREY